MGSEPWTMTRKQKCWLFTGEPRRSGPLTRRVRCGAQAPLEKRVMPRKKFQKPGAPKTAAKALEFQGFLVDTPPSSQLIPVFHQRSQKQRKTGGGDGRTQTRSSGLSQPSLPWQCCYFYLLVHDAQSSHFLCSREARLASALTLQCGTFSRGPEEERSDGGKGSPPPGHPSTRATV
ncbi:hypothetical protein HJG60_009524 [Phyllostomus discolor]|uniref:Uncharacterized protein n=1 Tax=Phyllostomus discolor TaxID=89673 RepID=A0A834D912_9CHIR|nr:hypothetical protein HJG60_009524 [Phyllostomus discolor]